MIHVGTSDEFAVTNGKLWMFISAKCECCHSILANINNIIKSKILVLTSEKTATLF